MIPDYSMAARESDELRHQEWLRYDNDHRGLIYPNIDFASSAGAWAKEMARLPKTDDKQSG